ncbi:MAG: hypothetical protein IKY44_02705, partial [Clostridia bacterium]|nr:hypothetical protein [Clostridia bacterium]
WNSRYFSSAWLLVEVPVVTVTYKTITYTDKRITETKKVAGQSIVTKSDVIEGDTQSTTITEPYGGYLLGRGYGAGSDYRNETVNPDSNQLSNESNYNVQSNVDLRIGTTTGYYGTTYKNFGISYLGKGYVLYDLSSVKGEKTEDTLSKNTETRYIDGKFVEVEVVKKKITETTISGITVSGSIKAGFQANSGTTENNANSYNITNMVYAIGSSRWANQGTTTGGTNNKGKYPADDAAWQALNVVYGIKKEGKTYTGHLNEATLADVMNSGYLTVRIDNCFNDWQSGGTLSNAYVAAWTLASFPQVNVEFSTVEYIETTVTPVDTTGGTTFNPTYEVYAQYNFISADGEVLSKTKLMGTMTGYGASAEVVPYIVDPVSGVDENDQPFVNFGKVEYLSSNGTLVDGKSVEISMDASRKDKYVLKDAYIEDVNTEIATLTSSGDNKYIITSTLDEDIKTNDIYKVRIIFDYYMEEASEPVTENSVKVNLHAHFLDSNGDEYGKIYTAGFAHLHNSSYILSLDDVNIPYGDVTLSGTKQVSAVFGTHQIYKFDSTKTEINIANATGGVVPNTYNTEVSTSDYLAKAYLDIGTDNTPSAGDILVVTYNGKNETSGQEIDVHLYYIEEPMYTFDVNYEFRFNGSFGEPAIIHTAESLKDQTFYKGSYVLPYDLLVNSTTIEIDELEYNISDFTCNIVPNGVVLNGNEVVSASGDNPSVTFVYTYKDPIQTKVDATVKHKYVINGVVNGVSKSDEIYLPNTTAILGNPEDTSVKSLLDNTAVVSTTFGTFKASDFVVSGIREVTDYGVTFKAYDHANGKYPTDFVPRNVTEIATIEITYTLQVYEIKVVETFTQNGSTQVNYKETTAYIPQNAMYTFNSSFGADFEPANDGVKLSAYTVTFSGDDVDNEIYVPGSVSFSVVGLTGGKTVYINYDYATSVDVKVENEFYINNTKLPADALVGVIPGKTEFTLAKDATEIIALATGKVVY